MDYNFHTHTYRCSHATGTAEEYINRAIECGIKYMGFSEHFPFVRSDGLETKYRMPLAQVGEYFEELYRLREKYAHKIDIKIGFELEYYPENFNTMLKNAYSYGAEYLLLGQHFLREELPNQIYVALPNQNEEGLIRFASNIVDGIKTGVFTYVAHPDLYNYSENVEVYRREALRICNASKEYNVPLEINFLGIRGKRNYPSEEFWRVAGEVKCPVTFGFDSHDIYNAYDGESLVKAMEMVEKYGLNYIGKPKMILLRDVMG